MILIDGGLKKACLISGLLGAMLVSAWPALLNAASAIATVDASIITTMGISTRNGLGFGDISVSTVPGTVVMTPSGTRTTTGGASINSSTAGNPATFDLAGAPNASFAITLPASVVLSDGAANSMIVDSFSSSPSTSGALDSNGQQSLFVGGTLNVNANQPFGTYTGQMSVMVEYN